MAVPRSVALSLTTAICLAIPQGAAAQQPRSSDPGRSPVAWTLIGAGIGFGAGLMIGLAKFDDAVYAERKITTVALIGAAGGGVAGALLSRRRPGAPVPDTDRDPLWNGMLVGAAAGAGVGMWYVPKANCKTDINPECPGILRLVVGIPAVAGGAALGALVDRTIQRRQRSAPGPTKATTVVSPVIGPGAVGVHFSRTF